MIVGGRKPRTILRPRLIRFRFRLLKLTKYKCNNLLTANALEVVHDVFTTCLKAWLDGLLLSNGGSTGIVIKELFIIIKGLHIHISKPHLALLIPYLVAVDVNDQVTAKTCSIATEVRAAGQPRWLVCKTPIHLIRGMRRCNASTRYAVAPSMHSVPFGRYLAKVAKKNNVPSLPP